MHLQYGRQPRHAPAIVGTGVDLYLLSYVGEGFIYHTTPSIKLT
jgi:hypothetical protein